MTTATVLNERYELRRRIFSEGNQAAYEALDRIRRESVLLVLIPPAHKLGADVDLAVRADIEQAFRVSAPSLLPLSNVQQDGDYRFLVMPMPYATNAWSRITKKRAGPGDAERLSPAHALRTADDLIVAARAAHAQQATLGFSPHQVWVDQRGHAKVQYYWLERVRLAAQASGDGKRPRFQTMAVEGAHFQAPEMTRGSAGAAPPADQFYIAAVLYALLTGQVPGGSLSRIRSSRPDVPKPMAQAIERGLAREPAHRHPDLAQFRRALHRRPAKLTFLIPMLLLLAVGWAAHALVQGGARLEDWAFAAEAAARRDAAFARSQPKPRPVPRPEPATAARLAGSYQHVADDGRGHTVTLYADGTFHYGDTTKDVPMYSRGLWWNEPDAKGLVLAVVSDDERRAAPLQARIVDGRLELLASAGEPVALERRTWKSGTTAMLGPLIRLDEPLSGTVLAGDEIRVVGDVAVGGVRVEVGDKEVPVVGTHFDTVWKPGRRGLVDVVVRAVAAGGFEQVIRRAVHIDRGAPAIDAKAQLAQVDGIWQLTVDGRITDDGPLVGVSVNNEPVEIDADGRFRFVRRGADAEGHAFAEIVAVDEPGRAGRRLLWADVSPIDGSALAQRFEAVQTALAEGRTGEAEAELRRLRADGGLIEQLDPEQVAALVRSGREPRISLDDFPVPPSWCTNDGTQTIELGGEVEWFAPGDKLTVAGVEAAVVDGRFSTRTLLPQLGPNKVRIQVVRAGTPVALREVEVWLAAADGDVPAWTGAPVSDAQRAASARYGLPIGHQNDQGMRFVLIPAGAFSRRTEDGRSFEVRVTRPYYLQVREVTRAAFEQSTARRLPTMFEFPGGKLPIDGPDRPAAGVTRAEAMAFAQRLTSPGKGAYRLPTEAEWELAARAGDAYGDSYWGSDRSAVGDWANFADSIVRSVLPGWPTTRLNMDVNDRHAGPWPVGTGRANAFGLRDMLGNVYEWVSDYYGAYDSNVVEDPRGPASGTRGVVRGGSFRQLDTDSGFARREAIELTTDRRDLGFRLVYEPGREVMELDAALALFGLEAEARRADVDARYRALRKPLLKRLNRADPGQEPPQLVRQLEDVEAAYKRLKQEVGEAAPEPAAKPPGRRSTGRVTLETGAVLLGRYEIKGMVVHRPEGDTYRVYDTVRDTEVGLKIVDEALLRGKGRRELLHRGLLDASRLNHPRIARVLDIHPLQHTYAITQELPEGETLWDLLHAEAGENTRLRAEVVVRIAEQATHALAYVHTLMPHATLRPESVWITDADDVRIADLGLVDLQGPMRAKRLSRAKLGTAYWAPEQFQDDAAGDEQSDQYTLALIWHEAISGEPPTGRVGRLRDESGAYPRRFKKAIERAISSKPVRRFADMDSFGAAAFGSYAREHTTPAPTSLASRLVPALVLLLAFGAFWISPIGARAADRVGSLAASWHTAGDRTTEAYVELRRLRALAQRLNDGDVELDEASRVELTRLRALLATGTPDAAARASIQRDLTQVVKQVVATSRHRAEQALRHARQGLAQLRTLHADDERAIADDIAGWRKKVVPADARQQVAPFVARAHAVGERRLDIWRTQREALATNPSLAAGLRAMLEAEQALAIGDDTATSGAYEAAASRLEEVAARAEVIASALGTFTPPPEAEALSSTATLNRADCAACLDARLERPETLSDEAELVNVLETQRNEAIAEATVRWSVSDQGYWMLVLERMPGTSRLAGTWTEGEGGRALQVLYWDGRLLDPPYHVAADRGTDKPGLNDLRAALARAPHRPRAMWAVRRTDLPPVPTPAFAQPERVLRAGEVGLRATIPSGTTAGLIAERRRHEQVDQRFDLRARIPGDVLRTWIRAHALSGLRSSPAAWLSVRVDGIKPRVQLLEPRPGTTLEPGQEVVVRFFAYDSNLETLEVQGEAEPLRRDDVYVLVERTLRAPETGALKLPVRAVDAAGNETPVEWTWAVR